jgi:hypothetical protein
VFPAKRVKGETKGRRGKGAKGRREEGKKGKGREKARFADP